MKTPAQVMASQLSEADFQSNVVKAAKLMGWMVYHTWNSRHSEYGFPDLTMVRRGVIIFAELKREGKEASPEQQMWLESLGKCRGVKCFVWRPSDWDEIERILS